MAAPDEIPPTPLTWSVRIEDVPARGLDWSVEATADERKRIAVALGLIELGRLRAVGRIDAIAGGIYRVKGHVKADVVQACVVSLDPVPSSIDEPISIEFRPESDVGDELAATPNYTDDFDVEPIANGHLETGRVVYEYLSASLDPYPRVPGAGTPVDLVSKPKGAGEINPFAVLSKLKDKS